MTVTIAKVQAFAIRSDLVGGTPRTPARRPPWTADAEVAGPMSGYPRYKKLRAAWRPSWPAVGCLATASDGSWGFGVSRYGAPVIETINGHLGPLLVDEPAMATEKLWDMMVRMASPYGAPGLGAYAISAIDLALWDLKGKLLSRPVYEIIGGPSRPHIECYATGGDTDWHMELGFRATKYPCPHGPADGIAGLEANEAAVARMRETAGPHSEIMLDCWMAFDVEYAVRLADRLRPYRLRWIEDCLMPEDMEGLASLRARLPWMGLASGEHWYMPQPFATAASRRLVDVLQPDIGWVGGLTACLRVAAIADAAGIEVIPHAGMNTPYGQHFGLAAPCSRWGEYFLGSAPGIPLEETRLFPGMAVPVDGRLVPSDAPGFGLGATLDDIAAMRV
ncbi:enolase C-terminal domain-like protein [Falsiroseomonas sp. HW251]|uniref:enolase C-terminal domain-like protein n=1 Tax=Falsiroseomonas sp. HW251 TaxID=3390998 RepID=UPI003D31D889